MHLIRVGPLVLKLLSLKLTILDSPLKLGVNAPRNPVREMFISFNTVTLLMKH